MKIVSILLVSVLFIGCSENRVLIDDLTNKGTKRLPIMYWEKGLFYGVSYDVYRNGQLMYEWNYKDGKIEKEKTWNASGQLERERNYKDGNAHGLWKEWHENGELLYRLNYSNNVLDGKQNEYYENGQLKHQLNYSNGEKDGRQKEYFDNGQLSRVEYYDNGDYDYSYIYNQNGSGPYEPDGYDLDITLIERIKIYFLDKW